LTTTDDRCRMIEQERGRQMIEKNEEEKRRIENKRFMDEWEKRPTNRDLHGNGCYRPDEVALTDEEYEMFG